MVVSLMVFRYQVVHWAVQRYFSSRSIKIDFKINNLGFSAVSLSNIVIDDSLRLDELNVGLKSFNLSVENISSIQLKLPVYDKVKVNEILWKLSDEKTDKTSSLFQTLKSTCDLVQNYDLDIQVDDIFQYDQKIPVGLRILHAANSSQTQIAVKGEIHASPMPKEFILDDLIYDLSLQLDCSSEDIIAKLDQFKLQMNKVRLKN
ncbi:MAG: hypothetical protein MJK18_06675, partial [Bdellovibrionales bacterium]|nr:hypothetical protein [Bdellovibrionales bacterium]